MNLNLVCSLHRKEAQPNLKSNNKHDILQPLFKERKFNLNGTRAVSNMWPFWWHVSAQASQRMWALCQDEAVMCVLWDQARSRETKRAFECGRATADVFTACRCEILLSCGDIPMMMTCHWRHHLERRGLKPLCERISKLPRTMRMNILDRSSDS